MSAPGSGTTAGSIHEVSSIFQQPWWLDAVSPGSWQEVSASRGGEIVARLPYVVKRRFGMTLLSMPPLTQVLGPWTRRSSAKYSTALSDEMALMTSLLSSLPRFDYFFQRCDHSITNWLPFYWAGFSQTTHYTYRFEDISDPDQLWAAFRNTLRNDIRKAERKLVVRSDLDVHHFLRLHRKTFERQGLQLPYPIDLVLRLDQACRDRGARQILVAQDASGVSHAAAYIVSDHNTAYYLMGGGDPQLRGSGAQSLLLWRAIQLAANRSTAFDFEGSMIRAVEHFIRSFGAKQVQLFGLSAASSRFKVLRNLKDAASALTQFTREAFHASPHCLSGPGCGCGA